MIHVLAVSADAPRDLAPPPSVEIVWARSAEDAIEKLARNRRIDAVLFFDEATERATAELLAAEGDASPPFFRAGAGGPEEAGAIDSSALLDDLRRRLGE